MKLKALADLEANMDNLEKVIVQKDSVIDGLKSQLELALTRLENNTTTTLDHTPNAELQKDEWRKREKVLLTKVSELKTQGTSLQKTIKSYESAVEKLTQKR